MKKLIDDMTKENPAERPKMPEALKRFEEIHSGFSKEFLRKRCVSRKDNIFRQIGKILYHWRHKIFHEHMDIPPVPIPYY
jgi:hypothetical protein